MLLVEVPSQIAYNVTPMLLLAPPAIMDSLFPGAVAVPLAIIGLVAIHASLNIL